jgi:Tfp pilus assembly protein PilN
MKITINLLPKYNKEELKSRRYAKMILRIGMMAILAEGILVVFLFFCLEVIGMQQKVAAQEVERVQSNSVYKKIKEKQDFLRDYYKKTKSLEKNFSGNNTNLKLLEKISALTPEGISLNLIKIEDSALTLKGVAKIRDNLLAYKENLEKETSFNKVNAPLSNFTQEKDVTFEFSIQLK